ncbi:MAG: energy transducer TonB [Flavobacteriales bacterium]|nr:energy transducer TonB [Flavobacteriales bacterium]
MEAKKTPKADLERRKGLFLQIGLIATIFIVWGAFEWKSYDKDLSDLGKVSLRLDDEEVMITERPLDTPPPPPPPPAAPEQIIIAQEDEKIEEMQVQSAETSSKEVVTVKEVVAVEEEVEEVVPFAVIEDKPIYPGCEKFKGNSEKLTKCTSQKLNEVLQKSIVYPQICLEMGISGKVWIKLTIKKDGSVKGELARGVDKNLDNEALRAVSKIKGFKPGMQRNKPVEVSYMLPVNFTPPQ